MKEYFTQEVDDWARISCGHFVGAVALLLAIPTLFAAGAYIYSYVGNNEIDRVGLAIVLLAGLAITISMFRIAYRLITNKK